MFRSMKKSVDQRLLELMDATGYDIVQTNGQRVFGPPPNWPLGEGPPKHSEVFVGRLPRDCFEDELVPLFSRSGPIYQLRLMMDFSGSNRGFAFVTYTNSRDARMAINLLNNYEIRPKQRIGVIESVDNCRLFIGNLPPNLTRKQVLDVLSETTKGVVGAVLHYNRSNEGLVNGFAFIEYDTHRDAAMARRKLCPEDNHKLFGTKLTIDWAIPEPNGDKEIMSKVTVLFVRYLSTYATEDIVRNFFSLNNELSITRVKRIKNYAFIHYEDRMSAELALNRISAMDLNDSPLSESGGQPIEVKWSIPPEAVRPDRNCKPQTSHHILSKPITQNLIPMTTSSELNRQKWTNSLRNGRNRVNDFPIRSITNETPKGFSMFWSNENWNKHWINKSRKSCPGLQ